MHASRMSRITKANELQIQFAKFAEAADIVAMSDVAESSVIRITVTSTVSILLGYGQCLRVPS